MLTVTIGDTVTTITAVTTRTVPVSRQTFIAAIRQYVQRYHALPIPASTAVEILDTLGSAYPLSCERGMILCRNDRRVLLTSEEIRSALRPSLTTLADALRAFPNERAVHLSCQGTTLMGLPLFITEETGLVCHIF